MKARLEFDLDDTWDLENYRRCNAATDLAGALWEIDSILRNKHQPDIEKKLEEIREIIKEIPFENIYT